ncbi:MAG: alanine racemase [Paracoccaceae bacterium]
MSNPCLTINLDAVIGNWRALDARSAQNVTTGAVVKANAYGLGLDKIARALMAANVSTYFVATAAEGAQLRALTGPDPVIFVFCGHMSGDASRIDANTLTPLLNSPEQFARHMAELPAHSFGVQLDTGMSRLGFQPADWAAQRAKICAAKPTLLMSHLACADEPDNPMNPRQLAAFHAMTDGVDLPRSLAATGGILLGPDYHFDITRPGIGLYGGKPFADAAPTVTLSIPVIQTRTVPPGGTVGYGNTWTAQVPTRVATIAAGYADGLPRALSGKAQLFHKNQPCPAIGRVSMDMMAVDISQLAETPDRLDIICQHQSIDDLATAAGTIGYEILTSLGPRHKRLYKGQQ